MLTVLFKSKAYDVQLQESQLVKPLYRVVSDCGLLTELLHPLDMLRLGVHNGGYFNSKQSLRVHGLPEDIASYQHMLGLYFRQSEIAQLPPCYHRAELAEQGSPELNYFGISASSSLAQWRDSGWLQRTAPEGWLEAYTQRVQLGVYKVIDGIAWVPGTCGATNWSLEQARMLSFVARHAGQLHANCAGDLAKRLKQRQALLNWSSPLAFI